MRAPDAEAFARAAASVGAQGYRPLRWIVQHDGAGRLRLPACAGVTVDARTNGRRLGVAITHNRALVRVRGPFVMALGADDVLEPYAVERLTAALTAHPSAAFAVGRTRFFEADDAELREHHDEGPYAPGLLPAGAIAEHWERAGHYGLVPGAVMWRTDHLRAVGGWAAGSAGADANALMAAALLWSSVWVAEPVYGYRIHANQLSRQRRTRDERPLQLLIKRQRVDAIRRLLAARSPAPPKHASPDGID